MECLGSVPWQDSLELILIVLAHELANLCQVLFIIVTGSSSGTSKSDGTSGSASTVGNTAGSTSALTYRLAQYNISSTTRTLYINQYHNDSDGGDNVRTSSWIQAMEVAA